MATTRLRRAFRYPEDSGDEGHEREELDEEGPFAMLFSRYVVPDRVHRARTGDRATAETE